MDNSVEVPQKLKTELPYDPAIPVLGIYQDKTIIQKDTCICMFIAASFTIAKTWRQPTCPSTEERTKEDVVHIYSGILLSHEKNKIMLFATAWMQLHPGRCSRGRCKRGTFRTGDNFDGLH